ncbi:MAG: 3-hydroxyacyl-CoA dehydrogenase family protein [Pseudomonadota bacterium]
MADIRRISVIGAGVMGHGIAQAFAQQGYDVSLYDLREDLLDQAITKIESNLKTFIEAGLETEHRLTDILSHIKGTTRLDSAVENADFVIEAVLEDPDLKRQVFKKIDQFTPEHAILASNTSTLSISEFGAEVTKKDKLIMTHWFNPPHIVPVVEVVAGKETSEKTFQITFQLLEKIGKVPVKVLKEIPGFLVNRIQAAMVREALSLLEQKVVSAEDLDRAVRGSFGFRLGVVGVLETLDLAGLDLMVKALGNLYKFLDNALEPQGVLKEKVERGDLGIKTGRGFHSHERGDGPGKGERGIRERDRKLLELIKTLQRKIEGCHLDNVAMKD